MNSESEPTKLPKKPYRRKVFRNIWLFFMLVFVLLFVAIVGCAMTYNDSLLGFILIPLVLSMIVGGLSFLIWIFVPSNKNFPGVLRIVDILLGITLASQFSLTVYGITYIFFYNIDLGESLYDLFTLLAFSFICFAWIKIKTKKVFFKSIIVLVLVGAYILGRIYALHTYQTYKDAQNLFSKANSSEGTEWMKETDTSKYLEGQRKYTVSLKEVAETPSKALGWGRKYYEDLYILQKEALDHNEKLVTGDVVLTKEESDQLLKDFNDRVNNAMNLQFPLPFWTDYFVVKQ